MGGHHMPQQILAVFIAIAALISISSEAFANGAPRTASGWQNYYKDRGYGQADLQNAAANTGLGPSARIGACHAGGGSWQPTSNGQGACQLPQQQQQSADSGLRYPSNEDADHAAGVGGSAPSSGLRYPSNEDADHAAGVGVTAPSSGLRYPSNEDADHAAGVGVAAPSSGLRYPSNEDADHAAGVGGSGSPSGLKYLSNEDADAAAEAGGVAAAGAADGARPALEDLCPEVPAGTKKAPDTPEEATTSACSATRETTQTACLMPGPKGMDAGTAAMYTMMMNQMVGLATQIASAGKNMAQQCKLQGQVSTAMTAINGMKATACGVMIGRCNARCDNTALNFKNAGTRYLEIAKANVSNPAIAAANEAKGKKCLQASRQAIAAARVCNSYQGQVMAMGFSAMQHGLGIVQNKQCEAEASAMANAPPMPTFSPIVLPNPTDCSDPNNQSLACFCSRESNSKSPMCAGFNPGAVAGGGATPNGPGNGIGSNTATPFLGTGDDGAGTDGNTVDPFATKQNASNGGDGYSAGGGSPPGGSLGSLGGDDGGGGGFGDPRSAITGTSGGQGNGLGGSGGGGGGGLARNNGTAGGMGGFMDKFNLKKFLPGSKYKTRGIAGMSVKSVDGITGPMGPSIWEKATRQYQEQIQKQNVILDK